MRETTLADLISDYMTDAARYRPLAKSTAYVLQRLARDLGHVALTDFNFETIRDYCHRRRHVDGVLPSTVQADFSILQSVFKDRNNFKRQYPDIEGKTDDFPIAKYYLTRDNAIAPTRRRERRVSPYEENQIIAWAQDNSHQRDSIPIDLIVPFALNTAMRISEICAITWADTTETSITIRNRKDPRAKEGNDQVIPLLPKAAQILRLQRIRTRHRQERVFAHIPGSVSQRFRRIVRVLGYEDLHFHDLRHEAISRLFESGLSIPEVAVVSGHKSWANLRRYTHLSASDVLSRFNENARH